MPTFLARMTWVDFRSGLDNEEALHCLVCGIRGGAPEAGAAAAVVPCRSMAQRPEGFVERRELEAIVELLCAVPASACATVAITTALRGAGGFGKTTLAQALTFDDRVRRTYPGGILWVTMGESAGEAGRVARIRDLLRWWQGEEPPAFETSGAAGARLREALAGERVLLVLDDVWKFADVAPFRGLAPGSALLVTTRDSRTLPRGSRRVEVDAMEVSEAVRLLASGLEGADAGPFAALASRLGEWPLLLRLVNRQLVELVEEGGLGVDEALREVGVGLDEAGLTAFDVEDHQDRELAVSRTLEVGLRRLSEEDRERFAQLAVFPEDTDVPLAVVERLWSLGPFATKKLCARLYDLSLLLRFERETATIRLHDVVRQYLLGEQREALPGLHRGLLERCRPASGRWPDLASEEDYLWRHLAHHLVAAGDGETLRELLLDFRYLRAKLDATDVNALMADYGALPGDAELRTAQGALRLSAHVLARDGEQLAGQLLGRLLGRGELGIRRLLEECAQRTSLRPLFATLSLPGGPLIRTFEGHTSDVRAVTVLDNRRIVSASADQTLRVWDVETGDTLRALEGHTEAVLAVAVLEAGRPAPRRVVSASSDRTLRVWDVETGDTLRTLEGHTEAVLAVAVLDGERADPRRVVSASQDLTLRVWDVETGDTLRAFEGDTGRMLAGPMLDAGRLDPRQVGFGPGDQSRQPWEDEDLFLIYFFVTKAMVALDERRVVSAAGFKNLRVWDVQTGETLRNLEGHRFRVLALAVLDEHRLVSASDDQTLRVWNIETGEALQTLEGDTSYDETVAVAVLDERRIVSGSEHRNLRLWDVEMAEPQRALDLEGHTEWVNTVAVLDEFRVVSASDDQTLRVWDVKTGETMRVLEGHTSFVRGVTVLDEYRVVSGSDDCTLRVWEVETGETLRTLQGHNHIVNAVAVLNKRRVISASDDQTLRLWDIDTARILAVFTVDAPVYAVAFDRDRRPLVAGDQSGRVHFLDLIEPAVAPEASRSRRRPDTMHS